MVVDCHCHIFIERIIENMETKPALAQRLHLRVQGTRQLLSPHALQQAAEENCIDACIILPSTGPDKVRSENDRFARWPVTFPRLRAFGTLHPLMEELSSEIVRVFDLGITGFKFSSFSQRFDIGAGEARHMFRAIARRGSERGLRPTLILDTFVEADVYFGALPEHLTTPAKLAEVVRRYPEMNIIAAHMGGLMADFGEIRRHLVPADNLYLDTSNAAHTLTEDQFVELLRVHGSSHIVFGTDWPWFDHASEMTLIESLLHKAGYDSDDRAKVFGENARQLLRL
jgi:uncharacterized protein